MGGPAAEAGDDRVSDVADAAAAGQQFRLLVPDAEHLPDGDAAAAAADVVGEPVTAQLGGELFVPWLSPAVEPTDDRPERPAVRVQKQHRPALGRDADGADGGQAVAGR